MRKAAEHGVFHAASCRLGVARRWCTRWWGRRSSRRRHGPLPVRVRDVWRRRCVDAAVLALPCAALDGGAGVLVGARRLGDGDAVSHGVTAANALPTLVGLLSGHI